MFKTELYQAVTLLLIVLLVDVWERRRPGFAVTRSRELSVNLLALAVVIVGGEFAKELALAVFGILGLELYLPLAAVRSLPSAVKILFAVVLGDLSLYWVHRAMHRRHLWRTHAFHHSIPEIWWLAGSRTSLTHLLLFAAPQILIAYYRSACSRSRPALPSPSALS